MSLCDVDRERVVLLLQVGMKPEEIITRIRCSARTISRIKQNLLIWGNSRGRISVFPKQQGRPGIPETAAAALEQYIRRFPYVYQDEMQGFLRKEYGIERFQSSISKLLKKRRFSRKRAVRISQNQSIELRNLWRAEITGLRASQCVFVDESAFNERTGWRRFGYAPIGHPARYHDDVTRGRIWSVLPGYTSNGYLPCTLYKEGTIDGDEFYR